jgi:hypothetical protein
MADLDLNAMAKQSETDPKGALERAGGVYKDAVDAETNQESKLGTASMPMGTDPSPFTLGPTSSGSK